MTTDQTIEIRRRTARTAYAENGTNRGHGGSYNGDIYEWDIYVDGRYADGGIRLLRNAKAIAHEYYGDVFTVTRHV